MSQPENKEHPADAEDPELAGKLVADRPVPSPWFRGALGRHLGARDPGYRPRPPRLRATVAACFVTGLLLILVGLLQATGSL